MTGRKLKYLVELLERLGYLLGIVLVFFLKWTIIALLFGLVANWVIGDSIIYLCK